MALEVVAGAPPLDTLQLSHTIVHRINHVRRRAGISTLMWADDIGKMARAYSADMAHHAYFGHIESGGSLPTDRTCKVGLGVKASN